VRLTDLIETFKGHDKVIFKLTGIGEMEYSTVEFKDAIDTIEALQQENERLADETIKLMRENAQNSMRAESLTAEKDELIKVLKQARKALYAARVDVLTKETDELAREALAAIDKVIGGKEDV